MRICSPTKQKQTMYTNYGLMVIFVFICGDKSATQHTTKYKYISTEKTS